MEIVTNLFEKSVYSLFVNIFNMLIYLFNFLISLDLSEISLLNNNSADWKC